MATGFSAERIAATLTHARPFWRGEWSGPLVSIYHQPTYRQEPNAESDFRRGASLYRQVCERLGTADVWTRTPVIPWADTLLIGTFPC